LEDLVERFGSAKMREVFEELIARTRRVLKERFRALVADGTYCFTDTVDSDGHGDDAIKLRWRLDVTPDRIVPRCNRNRLIKCAVP
jgi:N-methylhydantoinase B